MVNPVLEQQQHQPRLLLQLMCELLKERIAKKRWEFQHTAFDPLKLWKIANEVEALNWVVRKVQTQYSGQRSFSGDPLDRIIIRLKNELLRIEKYLSKPSNANFEFSERDRLKSRASAVEWSLFQMHFLLAGTNQHEEESR